MEITGNHGGNVWQQSNKHYGYTAGPCDCTVELVYNVEEVMMIIPDLKTYYETDCIGNEFGI